MQDIERYGLITLLFLVASVTAVFLWGGGEPEGGVLPAQVADAQARTAVGGTPLESQRTTSRVPTSQGRSEERGAHQGAQRNRRREQEGTAQAEAQAAAQAQAQAQQAAEAEAARLALVEERRRERERLEQLRAQADADAAAAAEAQRQREAEALAAKQAIPGPDVQRQQPPLLREITVAEGDSFWKIAERELGNGLRADRIAAVNPDVNPKRLSVGQKLMIPTAAGLAAHEQALAQRAASQETDPQLKAASSKTASGPAASSVAAGSGKAGGYEVREGDSAWVVAKRLCGRGSRWAELVPLNPTVNIESLKVGQRLQVPSDWSRPQTTTTVAQNTSSSASSRSLVR